MVAMGYVTAKKTFNGWALFYVGTSNEVYYGKRWASAKKARDYYRDNGNPA